VELTLRRVLRREIARRWRSGLRLRFGLWLGAGLGLGGFLGVKWLLAWCGVRHDGFPFLEFPGAEPTVIDYSKAPINYKRLALENRAGQGADSVSSASPALTSAACPRSPSSAKMK
jgi:hypothetical protein